MASMLKNNNDAVITKMAKRNLASNKRRSMTMILAVILSSFMLFSVFTVGATYYEMQHIQNIRMYGQDADAIIYGFTEEQREKCEQNPDIASFGVLGISGYVEESAEDQTPNVTLVWADETCWNTLMKPAREWAEGEYPTAYDEVMVTKEALKECGLEELGVGDSLTVTYVTRLGEYTGTFRISGMWEGYGTKDVFYMSKTFYDQSGYEVSKVSSGRCYIDFKQKIMTQKEQEAFIDSMDLEKQQNIFFFEELGGSVRLLAGLIGLILLTCLCAYLLIYNIMYLSVAGNVRYYGLLQTIGMTVTQVRNLMRRQMLFVMAVGIFGGVIIGSGVSFFLIPIVVKSLGIRSGAIDEITVSFRPWVFFLTVLLIGLTVAIAYCKPTRIAASVSPVEALGYRAVSGKKKLRRTGNGNLVFRMAKEQLAKDKKRTVIVMLSLAASLSVFVCLVTLLESEGARTIISNYMDMDMVIKNDTLKKEDPDKWKPLLDSKFIDDIEKIEGIREVHPLSYAQIIVPWEPEFADVWMEEFYDMWMDVPYEEARQEYQEHPENFGTILVGIDDTEFDYLNYALAVPVDKEDFMSGKTCILYRNDLEFSDNDLCGKTVTCAEYADPGNTQSFEIGALTDENYYIGPLLGCPPTIIVSNNVLERFNPEYFVYKVSIRYNEEYDEETEQTLIRQMQESHYSNDFSYKSKITEAESVKKAQGNMMEVGIGVVLILALIGIMNYINTTAGNIQSRQVELSIMESIGMTGRQVRRMLLLEGALLAGGAFVLTSTVGLGVTYCLYQSMNYRQAAFALPVLPLAAAAVVTLIICVTVPLTAYRRLARRGTLVERIREFE